ncbi:MAG: single-stranded-DNA-specific exonuclease RecJ [Candidatus Sedimenticola endophacoides]
MIPAPARRIRRPDPAPPPGAAWEGVHPLLQRVYRLRNVESPEGLDYGLGRLLPPSRLGQSAQAARLLHQQLEAQGRILIVADFDADGATSCALALRALRAMGARQVGYLVPNRFHNGYGLSPEIAAEALKRSPDLLITVDNGISSIEGVALLREAGVKVLVTDHHLPGAQLPAADVIVNPNNTGEAFPSKHLAGVGVIFYVMAALRSRLREVGWFTRHVIDEPNLGDYLDLVALGTVADVVPLDHNNRILVHQGLRRIRGGRGAPGILALLRIAGRDARRCVASDLGFAAGPRLNAAGRLDDMSLGIECLLCDDEARAMDLGRSLDRFNSQRREIEGEMSRQALAELEGGLPDGAAPPGICVYQPQWHQGVVGILASRIKERFNRPVIAFARGEEEGVLKGSARSVAGVHMKDLLEALAARHPGLLLRFGGHAMAAGLALEEARYPEFVAAFERQARGLLSTEAMQGVIHTDGPLEAGEMTLPMAEAMRDAGPWGQGFPEPSFDGVFEVVDQRVVGQRHLKMVLRPRGGGPELDAIAFNQADRMPTRQGLEIEAAYRLDVNVFRGNRSVQLMVEYFAPVADGPADG